MSLCLVWFSLYPLVFIVAVCLDILCGVFLCMCLSCCFAYVFVFYMFCIRLCIFLLFGLRLFFVLFSVCMYVVLFVHTCFCVQKCRQGYSLDGMEREDTGDDQAYAGRHSAMGSCCQGEAPTRTPDSTMLSQPPVSCILG